MSKEERYTRKNWWLISDDSNLIFAGQIVGKLNGRTVDLWKERIEADKAYAAKARKLEAERKKKEAPQYKVVTERPTVEALAVEGEKKLAEAVKAAEANLLENLGTGEEKLAKVVNEGIEKTTAIQTRARKPRRKSGGA
jgi:hypothetical protein